MVLFNIHGESLAIDQETWSLALSLGPNTWVGPAGYVTASTANLRGVGESRWSGDYDSGVGQEVTRTDAFALAAALDQAPHGTPLGIDFAALKDFCRRGGFIISGSDAGTHSGHIPRFQSSSTDSGSRSPSLEEPVLRKGE